MKARVRSIVLGGLAAAAVGGTVALNPTTASASGPTNETFATKAACENRAAEIRDGITGADCQPEYAGFPFKIRWRLYTYGV